MTLDDYITVFPPMRAAKVKSALQMHVRVNGNEFMTREALVRRCVAQGYTMRCRRNGEVVLMSPDGSWFDARNITVTGLHFAQSLLHQADKRNPAP